MSDSPQRSIGKRETIKARETDIGKLLQERDDIRAERDAHYQAWRNADAERNELRAELEARSVHHCDPEE